MDRIKELVMVDASRDRFLPAVKRALPFRIDPKGAREAVLLLHGLTGNPSELAHIGKALADSGYAVSAPRHPGHGTSRADILKTEAGDWLRSAYDAYLDLRAEYGTVHVLGHSMGGLLASSVAIAFGAPKLVLLAPAFLLSDWKLRWVSLINLFRKVRVRGRPVPEADRDSPEKRQLFEEYWADDILPLGSNILKLATAVRGQLRRLRSRTYVIVGEKDPVVPAATAALIAKLAVNARSMETRVLPGAGHLFTFDERCEETARLVVDWMGAPGDGGK